jgi:AcrR family transcriptional regulator
LLLIKNSVIIFGMATRSYSSPLRERQAEQTRELLLDTLTELLDARRADEVTTRDLARTAGVSESTVYRHFPDRTALISGLTHRLGARMATEPPGMSLESIDDLPRLAEALGAVLDEHRVEARAEALLNADPRQFSPETAHNTEQFRELIARSFPELDERELAGIGAVVRVLLSSQAWLRMREEFGVPGSESGPIVAWVIELVIDALRRGDRPSAPTLHREESLRDKSV